MNEEFYETWGDAGVLTRIHVIIQIWKYEAKEIEQVYGEKAK
jgi:hypothetical protein